MSSTSTSSTDRWSLGPNSIIDSREQMFPCTFLMLLSAASCSWPTTSVVVSVSRRSLTWLGQHTLCPTARVYLPTGMGTCTARTQTSWSSVCPGRSTVHFSSVVTPFLCVLEHGCCSLVPGHMGSCLDVRVESASRSDAGTVCLTIPPCPAGQGWEGDPPTRGGSKSFTSWSRYPHSIIFTHPGR